jgi:signal transduction histidine kinase
VTLWRRLRADLSKPESPTRREELPFLIGSAVVIVVVAQLSDPGSPIELVLLAPAVLAFVLRGLVPRLPSEVFVAVVLVSVTAAQIVDGNLEGTFFLCVFAVLYAAWHLGSTTRAVLVLVVAAATPWFTSVVIGPEEFAWVPWTFASVFIFALGRNLRQQRLLIEELEAAREVLAEAAVADERRRIARDLHDLAGHTLAAMMLHVTGARHVLRRDLDEAERALIDAESVGRSSLDQIRATVAALRTTERGTDPALAGSADLGALVDEYRRAGVDITARMPEGMAAIEGPVGTALHRITREALANVARHAPRNHVQIEIAVVDGSAGEAGDAEDAEVRLLVTDHGRRADIAEPDGWHFGLVGMRERARGLGGDLHAGPTADGWRVEATLPLSTTVPTTVSAKRQSDDPTNGRGGGSGNGRGQVVST